MTSVEKRNGKKGVRIAADKFGMTEMLTTRNGFQWNGFEADRELLEMVRDSINEWLGSTPETPVPHPPFGECTAVINGGSQLCTNAAEPGTHRCKQHSLNR